MGLFEALATLSLWRSEYLQRESLLRCQSWHSRGISGIWDFYTLQVKLDIAWEGHCLQPLGRPCLCLKQYHQGIVGSMYITVYTSRWMVDINDHHTRWSEDIRRYHEGLWRSPAKLFQAGSASMSQLHALPAYTSQLPVAAVAGEFLLWPRTPASSFSSDRKKEPVI